MDVRAPGEIADYLSDVVYDCIKSLLTKRKIANACFGPSGKPATFNWAKEEWEERA